MCSWWHWKTKNVVRNGDVNLLVGQLVHRDNISIKGFPEIFGLHNWKIQIKWVTMTNNVFMCVQPLISGLCVCAFKNMRCIIAVILFF